MKILGVAGLVNPTEYLTTRYPAQVKATGIMQGMDASAALIVDGKIIAAASEERFDRTKKSGAFPFSAIDYCLKAGGVSAKSLDAICGNFNFRPYKSFYSGEGLDYWANCLDPDAIKRHFMSRYSDIKDVPFIGYDHHSCHLHATLVGAPEQEYLAIIMDAAGEVAATSVYAVKGPEITRLARHPVSRSLGMFYSLITHFLGFAWNEDEYKVMGLASFGNPERFARFFEDAVILHDGGNVVIPCLAIPGGTFAENLFLDRAIASLQQTLGFDGKDAEFDLKADLSAGLQHRFTQALFHIAQTYMPTDRKVNLLLSGGCAENCSAAGELRRSGLFQSVYVGYASGDEGTALGAAAAHSFVNHLPVRSPHVMPFWGPAPGAATAQIIAEKKGLSVISYPKTKAMLKQVAADIADDKVVALCQGGMEYGARALGNRSLLANPTKAGNKDRINEIIKKRQNYRPFAPACVDEVAHRYFELGPEERYPYMTMLTTVRPEFREELPAITHVDGTARVQTVNRDHNANFYYLLREIERLTGYAVVLNTSFNVNHQPVVCSEEEAIDTFVAMGIDSLYIANTQIRR